ncbi:MAG TPA: outer membrane lipid asymmetry maintenance protein MlaD [Rhizomicrobium sp.]|jgi:phospholipid/cholesterol/gamma-HCH transport system substrate-binding protein
MSNNNTVETLIGAIVVAVAAGFLFFAYTSTGSGSVSGYDVTARFSSADGIANGTDVRLHGIKIGTVSGLSLDPKTYYAIAHLSIRNDVKVPDDSSVKITSSGFLGSNYVAIQPGGSNKMVAQGGELTNTQGAVDVMGLIGRAVMGGGK